MSKLGDALEAFPWPGVRCRSADARQGLLRRTLTTLPEASERGCRPVGGGGSDSGAR